MNIHQIYVCYKLKWIKCHYINCTHTHSTCSRSSTHMYMGRLGVERVDPEELPLYQLHTFKNEEQDHSYSEGSDKTCISIKIHGHF